MKVNSSENAIEILQILEKKTFKRINSHMLQMNSLSIVYNYDTSEPFQKYLFFTKSHRP